MKTVKPKKSLGQHFLNNLQKAEQIVAYLEGNDVGHILEIGPGMGVLSQFIIPRFKNCSFIEIDDEAVDFLSNKFPEISEKIIHKDFLKVDLAGLFKSRIAIIGNFPYNISSQILFKVLENKDKVVEIVGMFQKEVADRVTSKPGNRVYGILSVFIQAYYNTENLMILGPEFFSPPPKVNSSVIRLTRNSTIQLDCDEQLFFKVVKLAFNQRRKMLRNSLKAFGSMEGFESVYLTKRPEQLSVLEFVHLTNQVDVHLGNLKPIV
jgi:16S rRNA (adenine1518-N6/adenine1519-N6)-dimethyltransferase